MAIANIYYKDGKRIIVLENGTTAVSNTDTPSAKVLQVVTSKKERYTVYDDGRVEREKGKFEADKPILRDVYPYPPEPQLTGYVYTDLRRGIFAEDVAIVCHRETCREIDNLNREEREKQEKEFITRHKGLLKELKQQWKMQQRQLKRVG